MSDQPTDGQGAGSLPELTPEQETAVRRLLAEARHDAPIPTEVADRLDTVLADLTRDEPGSPGVAPVIDLAARRRRRNAAALLAGAAAVIVAGFGIGQVIDVGASSDDTAAEGGGSTVSKRDTADDEAVAPQEESGAGADNSAPSPRPDYLDGPRALLRLRSAHLEADITTQIHGFASANAVEPDFKAFRAAGCPLPTPHTKFGLGDLFPALFDDEPAVLALRPPAGGKQQADVLACDTAATLATTTIAPR
jgi:hypothetical protein